MRSKLVKTILVVCVLILSSAILFSLKVSDSERQPYKQIFPGTVTISETESGSIKKSENKKEPPEETEQTVPDDAENDLTEPEEPAEEEPPVVIDRTLWSLVLCNIDNPLPDDYPEPELGKIQKYKMEYRAAEAANLMIDAAKKDGINLYVCSAYRAKSRQKELFNDKMQEYLDKGYSKQDAYDKTATIIAVPGTSEHQTGLCIDVVCNEYKSLNSGYAKTDAAKWLKAHAAEYGFILRYPEDKEEITKIIFEPWHYRYVGTEYSFYIMENGLCLEEFLALPY